MLVHSEEVYAVLRITERCGEKVFSEESRRVNIEPTYSISSIEACTGPAGSPLYVNVVEDDICGIAVSSQDCLKRVPLKCQT